MKNLVYRITSAFIALLVLASTMSFTFHEHYCQGELKDVSLFVKAEKCDMEAFMNKSLSNCEMHMKKKKCCDDKMNLVQGQDELKTSFYKLTPDQQVFIAAFTYSYITSLFEYKEDITSFLEYPPPLIVKQIYKLDETYLI